MLLSYIMSIYKKKCKVLI